MVLTFVKCSPISWGLPTWWKNIFESMPIKRHLFNFGLGFSIWRKSFLFWWCQVLSHQKKRKTRHNDPSASHYFTWNWPNRPRQKGVRLSVTKTRTCYSADVKARKTKYALDGHTCVKIMSMHLLTGAWWVIFISPDCFLSYEILGSGERIDTTCENSDQKSFQI